MKSSIKRRWSKNILLSVIIVLLVCSFVILNTIYNRYQETVEQIIRARITKAVDTYFLPYSTADDESFSIAAADFTDTFIYKDIMDVWVLDADGKIIVSSSGFSENSENTYDDFVEALYAESKIGTALTRLDSGEHITAVTYILKDENSEVYGALRYMVSMQDIDGQFLMIALLVFVIFVLVILVFVMSGLYFIASIVNPLQRINQTTKEIAKGNFKVRINAENDDEIGELAASINDMAIQLSEIEKMKNEFISTVSHEIRTPLTAIKGWGETLVKIEGNPELQKKGLNIIVDETTRLSNMVEELLNFSRIQNGKMTFKKEVFNVVSSIEQAWLMYNQKAEDECYEFNLDVKSDYLPIYGDKDRIRQVLINVIDNAFKYTDKGGKIIITTEKYKQNVKIIVSDNGCGIDSKDLTRIKDKFFKANNTVRGTGIGLAVVDEIVNMHNGKLNIQSQLNKGTDVEILLPLYEKESDYE